MIKSDFPIFTHNPNLVYLDNAATTQKPQVVIDAISDFYSKTNANIGRSVCRLGDEATNLYEQAREIVQKFVNAKLSEEIIFTRSTTESINLIAEVLTRDFDPEDEIILTELEHHSNLIPWQQVAQRRHLKLKFIPVLGSGELDLEGYQKLFTSKTKLVAFSHLSNVLGTLADAQEIVRIAKKHEAVTLIDGAQSISKVFIDVQELGCDFFVFSGHKIYGPTGIGVLYGKRKILENLQSYQTGGKTIDEVWLEKSTNALLPSKFEAGTPNISGAIGLARAIDWLKAKLSDVDIKSDRQQANLLFPHEKELTDYAEQRLLKVSGVKIFGEIGGKLGVVSFVVDGMHSLDLATYLSGKNICLRSGHHCAQPLMRKLGVDTTLRISFGAYNNQSDIDYFMHQLTRAVVILT